jgi:hypothetical protein
LPADSCIESSAAPIIRRSAIDEDAHVITGITGSDAAAVGREQKSFKFDNAGGWV